MKKPKTLKEALKDELTKEELAILPSAFDIVGDLAIFSGFPGELEKKEKLIGETLLSLHKNIKTVLKKTKKYSGQFRLPKLKIIAGERKKETIYRENNVVLKLNPEKAYFSARLSTERKRIFQLVKDGELILVMFSGVAPYPITIAKNSKPKEVYGIEINPAAHKYALENLALNKTKNVKLFLGDVKKIVPKLRKKFDRILMPLPKGAEDFLETALSAIKKNRTIHFYDFLKEDEFDLAADKIDKACKKAKKKYKILSIAKCGQFGPKIYRVCVDFRVF